MLSRYRVSSAVALLTLVAGVAAWPGRVLAQRAARSASPAAPVAGTIVRIPLGGATEGGRIFGVAASGIAGCNGVTAASLGGEPLHLAGSGTDLHAFAGIPIDSSRGITLRLQCADGSTTNIRIPTAAGSYRMERLQVAPRFSAPPDSALSARLARESARAAQVSRTAHDTPPLFEQPFARPRPSRITSPFGGGRMFNGTVTSRHMGTDFAGAVGTPVAASNRGVVRIVDAFYLGGNVIYIDHGAGIVTAYLHLSKQLVAVGDTVQRGQTIGQVGASGRVTGPHLHFIARYGQITVDPASLFSLVE